MSHTVSLGYLCFELGQTKWRKKLNKDCNSLSKFQHNDFVTKQSSKLNNNNSPHGKFHQFLFPFSSKFSDLNFASYVLYNLLVLCHVSHTVSLGYLCNNKPAEVLHLKRESDENQSTFKCSRFNTFCVSRL